jgi:hypothetical protein
MSEIARKAGISNNLSVGERMAALTQADVHSAFSQAYFDGAAYISLGV